MANTVLVFTEIVYLQVPWSLREIVWVCSHGKVFDVVSGGVSGVGVEPVSVVADCFYAL